MSTIETAVLLEREAATGNPPHSTPKIPPFKIRNITIDPPLVLSPMAGVTDVAFRALLKRCGGIGLTVSEFISVEGLTRSNPKSKRQMRFHEYERPFAVQIFGGQVERMCMAAAMAQEIGADILDINCGCPAPKVVKHGGGSGLLRDVPRLEIILRELRKVVTIPLTIKIRAGFTDSTINALEVARLAEDCGVEHIALHGRTKEQGYRGLANWDLVRQIKEAVKVPVSGSGDVTSIEGAFEKWHETGCDGILIGRGAMQNPWIFRQIDDANHGREVFQPTLEDKRALLLEYFDLLREDMPELPAIGRMKQLAGHFTKGLLGGSRFRTALYHSHTVAEILTRIDEYFDHVREGRMYMGEEDAAMEDMTEPVLDSCEAAIG
ncbi:MAG: tRNA dihydrouridine synthase DusB [Pyrinomonadaceae bacterium MAG19_C2-C3]|nr:tRNA dihydrouridine synthase DusB [Pyrinomonadaceae bacterium MAG19_C2-C3]